MKFFSSTIFAALTATMAMVSPVLASDLPASVGKIRNLSVSSKAAKRTRNLSVASKAAKGNRNLSVVSKSGKRTRNLSDGDAEFGRIVS